MLRRIIEFNLGDGLKIPGDVSQGAALEIFGHNLDTFQLKGPREPVWLVIEHAFLLVQDDELVVWAFCKPMGESIIDARIAKAISAADQASVLRQPGVKTRELVKPDASPVVKYIETVKCTEKGRYEGWVKEGSKICLASSIFPRMTSDGAIYIPRHAPSLNRAPAKKYKKTKDEED